MIYKTSEYKDEVDKIITRFNSQLAIGLIPVFEAEESWQNNKMYADYPEFMDITQEECQLKFKKEYESKKS
jgi:hypothetical protein